MISVEDPPPTARVDGDLRDSYSSENRRKFWPEVSMENWNDWRWQQQASIISVAGSGKRKGLEDIFELSGDEKKRLLELETSTNVRIPPYAVSLMGDVNDPKDPIRIQVVPSGYETDSSKQQGMLDDPLSEDEDSPIKRLTHRYPDRVLLLTTGFCQYYCRFCTRSRKTLDQEGQDGVITDQELDGALEYIRNNEELREVIVSGGDPLMLKNEKLREILSKLSEIPHLSKVRIGSRVPPTLPQRLFDKSLLDVLADVNEKYGKLWLHTHFNHPNEITQESAQAVKNVRRLDIDVLNHSVLLRGVNDDFEVMKELLYGLQGIRVKPYYLFHCDPVSGAAHFRTSLTEGISLKNRLRGNISGAIVPEYVVDLPYGGGKVPADSSFRLATGEEDGEEFAVYTNFEGGLVRYYPKDLPRSKGNDLKVKEIRGYEDSEGGRFISQEQVSDFIRSGKDFYFPESSRRMQRRKNVKLRVLN